VSHGQLITGNLGRMTMTTGVIHAD